MRRIRPLLALLGAIPACIGQIGEIAGVAPITPGTRIDSPAVAPPSSSAAGAPPGEPAACTPDLLDRADVTPLRRLTRAEYDTTIRDLVGDTSGPARDFAPDGFVSGFDNNAQLPANDTLVTQFQEAAEAIAARAVARGDGPLAPLLACGETEACARELVATFGRRAFRRPLTAAESARWMDVFARVRATGEHRTAIEAVLAGMLQSPSFLYHFERGAGPARGGVVALSGFEVASRLSYFLWGTMPDERLFAAAAANRLASVAEVEAEARRMLADERAAAGVRKLLAQWLELEKIDDFPAKDSKGYPVWSESLRKAMRAEVDAFLDGLWRSDGKLATLLTSSASTVSGELATKVYRLPGIAGTEARSVALDPTQRSGILTLPGIIAAHSYNDQTSPIHRGLFVRYRLMCDEPPAPPGEVVLTPPPLDAKLGVRERYGIHESEPACGGCHRLIDEIGYGFEHYDAIGRWRTKEENGLPVDARGEVLSTRDLDGAFTGAVELGRKLASSQQVTSCVVTQWSTYGLGRKPTRADSCSLERLASEFAGSGKDLRALLVSIARSFAFRHTASPPATACKE